MSDDALIGCALSWVVMNRARAARAFFKRYERMHPVFGDGALASAARGLAQSALNDGWSLVKADRSACGRAARDPTGCALFVHPHDTTPAWAAGLRATALIGPLLFLVPSIALTKEYDHACDFEFDHIGIGVGRH